MLHLTNGDATAGMVRESGVPGEVRNADDILMEGPLDLDDARGMLDRARWLEARLGIPKGEYLSQSGRRLVAVRAAAGHDETVLWSEQDLFCTMNLVDLVRRFADAGTAGRLSLVCPPGRLGWRPVAEVPRLLASREAVDDERARLARAAWAAWRSPDPRALEALLEEDLGGWPGLPEAVRAHLSRFPSTRDGLGALPRALLRLASARPRTFAAIFEALRDEREVADFGLGDLQAHVAIRDLAQGEVPLVEVDDPRALDDPAVAGVWRATDAGRAVLAGEADAVALRGVDAWLGGVRLSGDRVWRWDAARGRLVAPQAQQSF